MNEVRSQTDKYKKAYWDEYKNRPDVIEKRKQQTVNLYVPVRVHKNICLITKGMEKKLKSIDMPPRFSKTKFFVVDEELLLYLNSTWLEQDSVGLFFDVKTVKKLQLKPGFVKVLK